MQIVIVEDHPLYLDALRNHIARTFERSEILATDSVPGGMRLLADRPADLVLLDYALPGCSGFEALKRILAAAGEAPVMVMSGVADTDEVSACMRAGARGFLPKTLDGQSIGMAVSLVANGGIYVPAAVLDSIAGKPGTDAAEDGASPGGFDITTLSPRETTMLRMLIVGASNKEIARELNLEEVTVKFYFTRLYQRMGVKNRSQAAVYAVRCGLTEQN